MVEQSWAVLKRQWKKEIIEADGTLREERMQARLIAIIERHLNGKSMGIANAGLKEWYQVLVDLRKV